MFEDKFPVLIDNYKDLVAYALNDTDVGMEYPQPTGDGRYRYVGYGISKGSSITFTGRAFMPTEDKAAAQVIYKGNQWGYVWHEDLKSFTLDKPTTGNFEGQDVLNELILNHQSILENNLLSARIIQLAEQKGIPIPKKQKEKLYNLQYRLIQRNQSIKSSGYVDSIEEAISPNVGLYNDVLASFMKSPGLGLVISGSLAIVISVVVIAGTFAAAYALFKSLHAESKIDYQYSAELTADLIKLLPPDVYKQLMDENEANAKLANKAIDKASGKSTMKTLTYVVAGFAGFYLIDRFLSTRSKK